MMRQNLALVLTLALTLPASTAFAGTKANGRRKLDQMSTTKERWDELMSDDQIEDDKPKREVITPAQTRAVAPKAMPAAAAPAATAATTARKPASVAPIRAAPAHPIFPVNSITFDEYLAENGHNSALSKFIPDHQLAFTDTALPAIITIPGSESEKAQQAAATAAAQPGALNGMTPAQLQNAAAAAGLIPGTVPTAGSVGGAGAAMGLGATGAGAAGAPNR